MNTDLVATYHTTEQNVVFSKTSFSLTFVHSRATAVWRLSTMLFVNLYYDVIYYQE